MRSPLGDNAPGSGALPYEPTRVEQDCAFTVLHYLVNFRRSRPANDTALTSCQDARRPAPPFRKSRIGMSLSSTGSSLNLTCCFIVQHCWVSDLVSSSNARRWTANCYSSTSRRTCWPASSHRTPACNASLVHFGSGGVLAGRTGHLQTASRWSMRLAKPQPDRSARRSLSGKVSSASELRA
jgi:hypothetical protein